MFLRMKKLTKLFLLAVVWLSLLWLSYAQNWWFSAEYNPSVIWANKCQCDGPFEAIFSEFFLIILWLVLIPLSLWTIFLGKKLKKVYKRTRLFYVPILNLYPLFKIVIWKFWFYFMALVIWFLWYFVYMNRDWCCHYHLSSDAARIVIFYSVLIMWILSIWLLIGLLYRLARKFGWDKFCSIMFVILSPFCIRFLSFGDYEYIWDKEDTNDLESK
jgi:hypothetical protein